MAARPHAHTVFKGSQLTLDFRVFWPDQMDKETVHNEIMYQYNELLDEVDRVFEEKTTKRTTEVRPW